MQLARPLFRAQPWSTARQSVVGISSAALSPTPQQLPPTPLPRDRVTARLAQHDKEHGAAPSPFLTDSFGRMHDYLRISLTEKCNLRCTYCMPETGVPLLPPTNLLTTPEIERVAQLFVSQGVNKIRLTGGEPTVRKDLLDVVERLGRLPLTSLGMTSNGISLKRKLPGLVAAGLTHLNLSLDTLDPFQYELITRRRGFEAVMDALEVAKGLKGQGLRTKINCVIIRGLNDAEVPAFVELTKDSDVVVRFIEYMPFEDNKWSTKKLVPSAELLSMVRLRHPELQKLEDTKNDTTRGWRVPGYRGSIGFISSMSDHFCGSCSRLRVGADGNVKVCLFGPPVLSLRPLLRSSPPTSDQHLLGKIGNVVGKKKFAHDGLKAPHVSPRRLARRPTLPTYLLPQYHMTPSHLRFHSSSSKSSSTASPEPPRLTHIDPVSGKASMVSVSQKPSTLRSATAVGTIYLGPTAFALVSPSSFSSLPSKKGSVLAVAQIAGLLGAKATSSLIPLCHPLALSHISVDLKPNEAEWSIEVQATAECVGATGVEMEALVAVSTACATVWDMLPKTSTDLPTVAIPHLPFNPYPEPFYSSSAVSMGPGDFGGDPDEGDTVAQGGESSKQVYVSRAPQASGGKKRGPEGKVALPRGLACLVCRKRKLKCGGERPSCKTCIRLHHECGYGDPIHTRLVERAEELEERVRSLEGELAAYRNVTPSASTPTTNPFPSLSVPHENTPPPHHSPFLHPDLPLPFVYGDHSPGSSRGATIPSPIHMPSPPQHSAYTSYGTSPQDSHAFPLPPSHQQPFPASNLQSFPFATSSAHGLAALIHPRREEFLNNGHPLDNSPTYSPTSVFNPHGPPSGGTPHAGPSFPPDREHEHEQRRPDSSGWQGQQGSLANVWGADLPPMDLVVDLANIYFLTVHTHLPVINRPRFLFAIHHPSSLAVAPSLGLIFAILAISAPYHNDSTVRARANWWYDRARERIDAAIKSGVNDRGYGRAPLTVEVVQALELMTMIEMGRSDHQRAFLSLGQALRVAVMLGLHRMDEDRIADRLGLVTQRRLRPPALHPLPSDPLLLEECRRTACALVCLDRLEGGCVGWPTAIAEADIRLLLPCSDELYEQGTCSSDANPLWWPVAPSTIEDEDGPVVSPFGWFCRVCLLGGRICFESYRPAASPVAGPFRTENLFAQIDDVDRVLEMDHQLVLLRNRLNSLATAPVRQGKAGVNSPILMSLILLNCLFVNLHHLRVSLGLSALPFNPAAPIVPGTPEHSMQRCLEGVHSIYEVVAQLAMYENMRTSPYFSRITIFTTFVPYILYCIAFPAKFAIGDWQLLAANRVRNEGIYGRVVKGSSGSDSMPSGDDVFGPAQDYDRLHVIDALCDAMNRIGVVWEVGRNFSAMVRGDRDKLAQRTHARRGSNGGGATSSNSNSNSNSPSQASQGRYHHQSS